MKFRNIVVSIFLLTLSAVLILLHTQKNNYRGAAYAEEKPNEAVDVNENLIDVATVEYPDRGDESKSSAFDETLTKEPIDQAAFDNFLSSTFVIGSADILDHGLTDDEAFQIRYLAFQYRTIVLSSLARRATIEQLPNGRLVKIAGDSRGAQILSAQFATDLKKVLGSEKFLAIHDGFTDKTIEAAVEYWGRYSIVFDIDHSTNPTNEDMIRFRKTVGSDLSTTLVDSYNRSTMIHAYGPLAPFLGGG